MTLRSGILAKIEETRVRQFDLPGSEFDAKNSPNDWIAISSHYLNEEVRRGVSKPNKDDFEDSLLKAAAVIVAALEHLSDMDKHDEFRRE